LPALLIKYRGHKGKSVGQKAWSIESKQVLFREFLQNPLEPILEKEGYRNRGIKDEGIRMKTVDGGLIVSVGYILFEQ